MNQRDVFSAIREITLFLTAEGLSIDYKTPVMNAGTISWSGYVPGIGFGNDKSYRDIYEEVDQARNYSIKLIDGGIIQIYYNFVRDGLTEHKLTFLPNPILDNYDDIIEELEQDELYLEIVDRSIMKTAVRIDYSNDDRRHELLFEPRAHMHIGYYENCRVPLIKPICPYAFLEFVLLSFYSKFYRKHVDKQVFRKRCTGAGECIEVEEKRICHLVV